MFVFLQVLAFVFTTNVADYSGTWKFSVPTPDGNVAGEMVLEQENGEYEGTVSAYGSESEMTDIEFEGNKLTFSTSAAGYTSTISGTFDGDTFTAVISVEGMEIPMVAKRE